MNNAINFLLWLLLAILLGWLWFGPWYPCWQEVFCAECIALAEDPEATPTDSTATLEAAPPTDLPIYFKWDEAGAYKNDSLYPAYYESIMAEATDDNILEIVGMYYEDEPAPEGYENMGLARAAALRALFPDIPDERIRLRARTINPDPKAENGYFAASEFKWLEPEKTEKESVEELADRVIIRFPYNSTTRIQNPQIDQYVEQLAERVKTTGEQITLTGHTSNEGQDDYNLKLGQARADVIRDLLLQKGVDAKLITVDSKGESQPVASNSTETGREENRRVELRLIKNDNN